MAKIQKSAFLVVPSGDDQLDWLRSVLTDEGELVVADMSSAERVRQLLNLSDARVVFVGLTQENLRTSTAFIEDLMTFKSMLTVVAVADHPDQEILLGAIRAGARDFVTTGTNKNEVVHLINRLQHRAPVITRVQSNHGSVVSLISARPGSDTPLLTLHLALALQEQEKDAKILLLDLGAPAGDVLTYLGIQAPYSFPDAIQSIRRLDSTLIDSAFAKHESGIKLLAMPEDYTGMAELTSADIYVLLGVLKQHFSHIIVNLGGVPYSDFLNIFVSNSDMTITLLEQSVPSCKQNMDLIRKLSDSQLDMNNFRLVVDRYLRNFPPDAEDLAQGINIKLLATLPSSGIARLKMMNSGESLFKCAPRDPYTITVKKIAKKLKTELHRSQSHAEDKTFFDKLKSVFRSKT